MSAIHTFIGIAIGTMALALPAQAQGRRDLGSVIAELDQGFVCPQFRPDDAARRADMLAFSRAIASVGPTRISYRQAAYIHARMLQRHNCASGTTVARAEPDTGTSAPVVTPAAAPRP